MLFTMLSFKLCSSIYNTLIIFRIKQCPTVHCPYRFFQKLKRKLLILFHQKVKMKQKREELPSFLLNLKKTPKDFVFPPKPEKSKPYLGPMFFGPCHELQPPLHELTLGRIRHVQTPQVFRDDILGLILPIKEVEKRPRKSKEFHPVIKRKKLYPDPYPHKCLGRRKAFVREHQKREIDLGETTSVIVGETTREISLICVKRTYSETPEMLGEFVSPSDLRETRIKYMPYLDRIAHAHFPKEFVTVTVHGPTIPGAINITQLPSRRRWLPDYAFIRRKGKECQKQESVVEKPKEKLDEVVEKLEKEAGKEVAEPEEEKAGEEEEMEEIKSEFEEQETKTFSRTTQQTGEITEGSLEDLEGEEMMLESSEQDIIEGEGPAEIDNVKEDEAFEETEDVREETTGAEETEEGEKTEIDEVAED